MGDELGAGGTSIDDLIQERNKSEEELQNLKVDIDRRIDDIKDAEEKREEKRKEAAGFRKASNSFKKFGIKTRSYKRNLIEIK